MRAEIGIDVLRIEFGVARSVDAPVRVVAHDPGLSGRHADWQLQQASDGHEKEYPRGTRFPKLKQIRIKLV